jgi:hypothetical protein
MFHPQICKFLQNSAQLCLKTFIKVVFVNDVYIVYIFELEHYVLYLYGEKYVFANFRKSADPKKVSVRES